jgi:hypothetical protein
MEDSVKSLKKLLFLALVLNAETVLNAAQPATHAEQQSEQTTEQPAEMVDHKKGDYAFESLLLMDQASRVSALEKEINQIKAEMAKPVDVVQEKEIMHAMIRECTNLINQIKCLEKSDSIEQHLRNSEALYSMKQGIRSGCRMFLMSNHQLSLNAYNDYLVELLRFQHLTSLITPLMKVYENLFMALHTDLRNNIALELMVNWRYNPNHPVNKQDSRILNDFNPVFKECCSSQSNLDQTLKKIDQFMQNNGDQLIQCLLKSLVMVLQDIINRLNFEIMSNYHPVKIMKRAWRWVRDPLNESLNWKKQEIKNMFPSYCRSLQEQLDGKEAELKIYKANQKSNEALVSN